MHIIIVPYQASLIISVTHAACIYGDPHIVSLDGFKYTFNGLGEYVLISTPGDQFTLQGRMEVPTGDTLLPDVAATVFTAIVAKELFSDTVQIQLASDGLSLEMLVNGELVDFSDLFLLEFNNVSVSADGSDTLSATFSTSVYLEVKHMNGIISTMLVSVPQEYEGETSGLMGNYNGDTADDLTPRGEVVGIPLNSSLEDVHFTFGLTCEEGVINKYCSIAAFFIYRVPPKTLVIIGYTVGPML